MILLICVANRCQAPHYEDLVTLLLELPYLCIAKCHLSGRTRHCSVKQSQQHPCAGSTIRILQFPTYPKGLSGGMRQQVYSWQSLLAFTAMRCAICPASGWVAS